MYLINSPVKGAQIQAMESIQALRDETLEISSSF